MKQTINQHQFINAFRDHERERTEQFSREALCLLFEHFEALEQDTGKEIELDVIAICCEYSESTVSDLLFDYDTGIDKETTGADLMDAISNFLQEKTTLVGMTEQETFVFQQF